MSHHKVFHSLGEGHIHGVWAGDHMSIWPLEVVGLAGHVLDLPRWSGKVSHLTVPLIHWCWARCWGYNPATLACCRIYPGEFCHIHWWGSTRLGRHTRAGRLWWPWQLNGALLHNVSARQKMVKVTGPRSYKTNVRTGIAHQESY